MSQYRLRWLTIALPVVLTTSYEVMRVAWLEEVLPFPDAHIVGAAAAILGVFGFSLVIYAVIGRSQRQILAQNQELAAVNALGSVATRARDVSSGLGRAMGKVLEATSADAVEIRLRDHDRLGLPASIQRASLPEWSSDLARLVDHPLVAGQTGYPVFVADVEHDPRLMEQPVRTRFRSFASVPLRVKEHMLGHLHLAARSPRVLGPVAQPLLSTLARQIGVAIENRRLFEEIQQREREIRAIYEIATQVLSSLDVDCILNLIVENTRALFNVEVVALCLRDEQSGQFRLARRLGPEEAGGCDCLTQSGEPTGESAGCAESVTCPQADLCAFNWADFAWHTSAPLRAGNQVVGELCVGSRTARSCSDRERELLAALASQAAIALNNARLHDQAQQVAILEERDRIARELHDSLAQVLGYLALRAKTIEATLVPEPASECAQAVADMATVAEEAYIDVREAILGLRESIGDSTGLTGSVAQYIQKFSRQSGIATKLILPTAHQGDPTEGFPPAAEVQLVRIIQEALTNVRKHSRASHAWVRFDRVDGRPMITIEDDGYGFDTTGSAGQTFGMQTMAERAERIGAQLDVESAPGRGTRVTVRLPAAVGGMRDGVHDGGHQGSRRRRSPVVSQRTVRPDRVAR